MALRDQPYIPLYVQDFLTDEKLNECSAESTGVYIRLLCILHKSSEYGKILLRQKDKQTDLKVQNFAYKLAKHMPYEVDIIERSLLELLFEKVLTLEDDYLIQKRMVEDNKISLLRSKAGKKGGIKTTFAKGFAQAKSEANPEDENENENEIRTSSKRRQVFTKPTLEEVKQYIQEIKGKVDPAYFIDYYESIGWKRGKGSVKDWKATIRTWERNGFNSSSVTQATPPHAKENEILPELTNMLEGQGGDACPDDVREMVNRKLGRVK